MIGHKASVGGFKEHRQILGLNSGKELKITKSDCSREGGNVQRSSEMGRDQNEYQLQI